MAIKSIRIDDRLIHGQVASSWLRYVGAEQILCISDRAAKNRSRASIKNGCTWLYRSCFWC